MSSFAPTNEDVPPLLDGGGKLEVWRIDGSAKTPVPKEDIGKFYSGDCYIVLYTYYQDYLCHWIGEDCNKPGVSVKLFKEGTESSAFWLALGGKQSYISKEVPQEIVRDSTKATVNNPNHLIQGMYYEIEHNLLGDYADTLGMTNFVLVKDISVGRVQLWYPSPVSLKSFATSPEEIGPPFMDLPLDVEDSVAFLGSCYTSGDLTRARMDEGLSFFVPEKFLPEIVGFKVDLTPSYMRLASVGESVQSGMLNKDFALVSFTRFGGYRVDDPLEDARYLVDMNLTWVDGLIKSVEDNLAKKIYYLQDPQIFEGEEQI